MSRKWKWDPKVRHNVLVVRVAPAAVERRLERKYLETSTKFT